MDRQNLIHRLVTRKLQAAGSVKALCLCLPGCKALCWADAGRRVVYFAQAQPKK
jgi:hypothetical protein